MDVQLLESISSFLGCGTVRPLNKDTYNLAVLNFTSNYDIIIPFFNKYKIQGIKHLNYLDPVLAVNIIKTNGDIKEIIKLKNGMNKNRSNQFR